MRVRVTGYLTLRGLVGKGRVVEVDAARITLHEFVQRLACELGTEFAAMILDPRADLGVSRDISILVNGRHYTHLPDRLDTELADGDDVAVFPPVAGG